MRQSRIYDAQITLYILMARLSFITILYKQAFNVEAYYAPISFCFFGDNSSVSLNTCGAGANMDEKGFRSK